MPFNRTRFGKLLTATLSLALVLVIAGRVGGEGDDVPAGIDPRLKFSQRPDEAGEDAESNIDWTDLVPNVVVADDFVSDGRPITAIRWWGSNIADPKVCDSPFTCGGPATACGTPPPGSFGCYCFKRPDGTTGNCAEDQFCDIQAAPCPNGDIDCPTGQKCFIDTCCGPKYCFPNCPPPTTALDAADSAAEVFGSLDPSTSTLTMTGSGLTVLRKNPAEARTPSAVEGIAPVQVADGPVLNGVRVDAESAVQPMADTPPVDRVGLGPATPPIDGWMVSFHEPLELGGPPSPPLALYFCDAAIVAVAPTPLGACDTHPVQRYDANLADCCLVHSNPDSRNGEVPGQKSAFWETACYQYDIDIQAVVGVKYVSREVLKACDPPHVCKEFVLGECGDPALPCVCATRPDGSGACHESIQCPGTGECPNGDIDCTTPGTKCFVGTCCGVPICAYNCGEGPAAARVTDEDAATSTGVLHAGAVPSIPTAVVESGVEANVAEGKLGVRYTGNPLQPQGGIVADAGAAFPSAASTVVGSVGFIDATQVGYFWSAARGDRVTQLIATGELAIERAIFDFVVPFNSLRDGALVDWDILINATVIGSFTVVQGQVGPVHLDFIFAPLAGPNYTVQFKVTNEVADGAGSHTLSYAGANAGTVRLITSFVSDCVAVETGNTATIPFWGWHTTSVEHGLRPAVQSVVSMSGPDWLYGPWSPLATDCSEPNMAFQLFTDTSGHTKDCQPDGIPDSCQLAGNDRNENGIPDECDQPTVKKWESVVTHTRTGVTPLDIPLEITEDGLFSEPRGGVRRIVVTLDVPIDPASATEDNVNICGLKPGIVPGTFVPVNLSGIAITVKTSDGDTKLEINFNPRLPDFARYHMVLKGISGPGGPLKPGTGGLSRTFWALQGDTTGDDRVNATDVGGIRSLVPRDPINPAIEVEVRADINNDKRINATDVSGARSLVTNPARDARNIPIPDCPLCGDGVVDSPEECESDADCTAPAVCINCNCVRIPECTGEICGTYTECNPTSDCTVPVCFTTEHGGVCAEGATPCVGLAPCTNTADCTVPGALCAVGTCCGGGVCLESSTFCEPGDECFKEAVCSGPQVCTDAGGCNGACFFTAAGNTRCFFGEFLCVDYPTPCTANSDCPVGSACSNDCCGMHCVPLCGGSAAAAPVRDYSAGTISGDIPAAPTVPTPVKNTGTSSSE